MNKEEAKKMGATHYREFSSSIRYIKFTDGAWWYLYDGFWILANLQEEFSNASFKFKPL